MFDIDRFVADCRAALAERSSEAIHDVVRRVVAEPDGILKVLGEPSGASAGVVFRDADLTILNVIWGARQWTLPHNHNHRAIIGMYGGGEDNIFWRRLPNDAKARVEAAGAQSLRLGDVAALGRDIIHSVTNPLGKLSMALHVYDADFMADPRRSHRVPLRRRRGLPDVRPGPRKVGLRQARGYAGRQRAFRLVPMHRLLAWAARVPTETLSVLLGDATWHSKAFFRNYVPHHPAADA
jgi:predicted metal-dependent enzyme (double-stranded beta helix superfamily)